MFADPVRLRHVSCTWFFRIFSAPVLLSGLLGPLTGRIGLDLWHALYKHVIDQAAHVAIDVIR
jgi:hypothetical protein